MPTATIDTLARVSRVNGRKLMSDRLQRESAGGATEAHGYTVGEVVEALNVSGGLVANGAQWQRALQRVRDGASAGVAVAYIDRLSRDVATGLAWVDELARAGGVLISGGRVIDMTNPHERSALSPSCNMGELQLNIYKEKNREVMAAVKRRGILDRVPYGLARTTDPADDPKRSRPRRARRHGAGWSSRCALPTSGPPSSASYTRAGSRARPASRGGRRPRSPTWCATACTAARCGWAATSPVTPTTAP